MEEDFDFVDFDGGFEEEEFGDGDSDVEEDFDFGFEAPDEPTISVGFKDIQRSAAGPLGAGPTEGFGRLGKTGISEDAMAVKKIGDVLQELGMPDSEESVRNVLQNITNIRLYNITFATLAVLYLASSSQSIDPASFKKFCTRFDVLKSVEGKANLYRYSVFVKNYKPKIR